jgi:hypothetical protein
MKKIGRGKFFVFFTTGFMSLALFRNFNFEAFRKKTIKDHPVKVEINPLAVSRNKSGENNVRK